MGKAHQLIFVYNADSGKWNAYMDMAHKLFSPSTYPCSLCDITHGIFNIRPEWENFVKNSPIPFIFLHKDEFENKYPQNYFSTYPFVLSENKVGNLAEIISAEQLNKMKNAEELIIFINQFLFHGTA